MFDQEARLERLLARHQDAILVEPTAGRPAVIRRDQILVDPHDASAVEDMVRRWYDSRHDEHGVCRMRLRAPARVDVCELAAQLAGDGRHRRLAIAPNHLVHGQPMWWVGPADQPRPAARAAAPALGTARRDVTIAVLDTGLSAHPWYVGASWFAEVEEALDADLDFELDAQAGHGTFIAGVLLRHAPAARIRALRVLGGDGVGDEADVIRALSRLAARGDVDVINLSLGCYTYDDRPSPALSRAIAAFGRRTAVVASAGNAASDRPFWPAALKPVIAVAALDGDDRAWFSNYGWWVDAAAPGVRIESCYVNFAPFEGYATWSGTSFAAPAVAGRIAHVSGTEDLTAPEAAARVLDPTHPDLGTLLPE